MSSLLPDGVNHASLAQLYSTLVCSTTNWEFSNSRGLALASSSDIWANVGRQGLHFFFF